MRKIPISTEFPIWSVKAGKGVINNSSSLSLSFEAIKVKYLLKLSAITLLSSTKVPSIIKDFVYQGFH